MSDFGQDQASDAGGARVKTPHESPIVLSRVGCPVCRTVNEYETVRPGSYIEEGIDTDFRPSTRRWANPRYQSVNPLLYFMATCTTCFYTREFNRAFREPSSECGLTPEQQKELRMKHLAMLSDAGSVARRLGSSLWPASYPIQTAISKLLLGVLDENLLERPSNYDLARWYLRAAWLFREAKPHDGPDLTSPATLSRRDLKRATDEMRADLVRLHGRVTEVMQFLHAHPEAAQKHPEDSQGPLQCRQGLQRFVEQANTMTETLAEMRLSLTPAPDQFVGAVPTGGGETFGDHASFTEFLRGLKLDSPLMPINEEDALLRSLSHYKMAFESNGGIEAGNGAMLTAYLIGELSRRLAYFDDAERFLDMARMSAHVAITENGADKPRSALARHIAILSERQSRLLYDTTSHLG